MVVEYASRVAVDKPPRVLANLICTAVGVVELLSVTEFEVVEVSSLFMVNDQTNEPQPPHQPPGSVTAKSVK